MRRQQRQFVHVQVDELHAVGACLAVPATRIGKLVEAGFVLAPVGKCGYAADPGASDMLIRTPGSFVVRQ